MLEFISITKFHTRGPQEELLYMVLGFASSTTEKMPLAFPEEDKREDVPWYRWPWLLAIIAKKKYDDVYFVEFI